MYKFNYNGNVTETQKDFFETWGFIIYENIITEEEKNIIIEETKILNKKTLHNEIPKEDIDDLTTPGKDDEGNVILHRLPYINKYCKKTQEIIEDKKLLNLGRDLLQNREAFFLEDTMHGALLQTKTFNSESKYKEIDWHIDFPENHILSPVVTLGIYLDESKMENGCLQLIPGSHNIPINKFVPESLPIEVKATDLVCHVGGVFHASTSPTVEKGIRRTLYLYCCGGKYPGKYLPFGSQDKKEDTTKIFKY